MRIVSICSHKGGVGKTSVVLGLAGAAMSRGLATLVVDLDPQGNASSILGPESPTASALDLFARPGSKALHDAVTACSWESGPGEVDVVVSDPMLIKYDAWKEIKSVTPRLAKSLEHSAGYDLVLIDCPPSLGTLAVEALAASHGALIVTEPTYFGVQGALRAADTYEEVKKHLNRKLKDLGVIVNRSKSTAEEHDYRARELAREFGKLVIKPVIPERIAIQQAEGSAIAIQKYGSAGSREVAHLFDTHLTKLLNRVR
jgi:cellulose biosynthesis protein BcsQ